MADPKPEMVYDFLAGPRAQFIDYAEAIAKLTLPTLAVRGERVTERPWTSRGTSAVRALASASLKITMPPGVLWSRLDFPPYVWTILEARTKGKEELQQQVANLKLLLRSRTIDTVGSLMQKNTRSRMGSAILRNLVEGNTGFHNTPEGLRVFPLRSIVTRRNEYGEVDLFGFQVEEKSNPMEAAEEKDLSKPVKVTTIVDYEDDLVWEEREGTVKKLEDEDPSAYFVMVPERPDVDDYAIGYAYNYIRLIAQIDHAEASLAQAMAYASWNPVGLREGSVLAADPDQVMKREEGKPLNMQEGDIIWPNRQAALADWGFVHSMRNDDAQELGTVFAMGIKDRPLSADTSATAVIQMIDELASETQDLLSAYEDTMQRPLIRSEHKIHEALTPLFTSEDEKFLGELLRIVVTTGVNALDKQRTMVRFAMQVLPAVKALDDRVQVEGLELLDRIGESMLVETEGLYSQLDPLQQLLVQRMMAGGQGGGQSQNGELPREETIMTAGGPQPPQPAQAPPPAP